MQDIMRYLNEKKITELGHVAAASDDYILTHKFTYGRFQYKKLFKMRGSKDQHYSCSGWGCCRDKSKQESDNISHFELNDE